MLALNNLAFTEVKVFLTNYNYSPRMKSFCHFNYIQVTLLILSTIIIKSNVAAQINSQTVLDVSTIASTNPEDTTENGYLMSVIIDLNDASDFGVLSINVYDTNYVMPIFKYQASKAELISGSELSGNQIDLEFYVKQPDGQFRIETFIKNDQGANIPMVITNYNLQ